MDYKEMLDKEMLDKEMLDKEMLKVMEVTTHCEEDYTWQTLKVKRRLTSTKEIYDTLELVKHWHPSTDIVAAMDVIETFKEPYGGTHVSMGWDPNNSYWFCHIAGEEVYDGESLSKAICRCVLKIIKKKEEQND